MQYNCSTNEILGTACIEINVPTNSVILVSNNNFFFLSIMILYVLDLYY